MRDKKLPQPTDGELPILRVLWSRGSATVREVHDQLKDPAGYTTTLKLMQIMADKGLVARDQSERAHVYRAQVTQEKTQRQLIGDLATRAFGGSPVRLAMQALSAKKTSPAELNDLRRLLDSLEERGGKR